MTMHDATEQAYKNGYEAGKRDAQKWIPVTEPPKETGCYLVAGNYRWEGKPIATEAFWNGNGWLSCYDKHPIKPPVTHWMPLPEPPKEDA